MMKPNTFGANWVYQTNEFIDLEMKITGGGQRETKECVVQARKSITTKGPLKMSLRRMIQSETDNGDPTITKISSNYTT